MLQFFNDFTVFVLKPNGTKANTINSRGDKVVILYRGFSKNQPTVATVGCQLNGKINFLDGSFGEDDSQELSKVELNIVPDNGANSVQIILRISATEAYPFQLSVDSPTAIISLVSTNSNNGGKHFHFEVRGTDLSEDLIWVAQNNCHNFVTVDYKWINSTDAFIHVRVNDNAPKDLDHVDFEIWRDGNVLLSNYADGSLLRVALNRSLLISLLRRIPYKFLALLLGIILYILYIHYLSVGGK